MKIELNAHWIKGDSEIHLFRKMSNILKTNYDTLFIQETHQRRISYYSETVNRVASRELSDLWIIAYSPLQKRIRTTFLQAKYHRKNILPEGVFKGDYFQYELLANRPKLVDGGTLNFPLDVLYRSCCDSVGSYGIFYIDNDDCLNLAYCCASNLSTVDQPTTYGQFSINLSFPDDSQGIKFCECSTCAEFNYTFEIDTFTDHLLQLNIGEELGYNYPGLIFLRNFFTRNITTPNASLLNTIDDIVGRDNNNNNNNNNNNSGGDDFFKSEGGNPNILLVNVDKEDEKKVNYKSKSKIMITIQELLYNRGLDKHAKIKLVRHKDKRTDLYSLYKSDRPEFLAYQNSQSKDVFNGVDYIVSFIGEEGIFARFIGVYKIISKEKFAEDCFGYQMVEVPQQFDDPKERVIIKWSNAISWHQWINNEMEVIEIKPGLHYKQFTDYFDFILNFDELKEIINNQYSHWKKVLSITKGVYLINDNKTGKLYVGSAYGENGIWGRWSNYSLTNGHGNNKMLKALVNSDDTYGRNFQFSILMLLPRTITADEAIKKERLFKNKLGTNSFGLNDN